MQISRLATARIKIHQIMSFLEQSVSFSSNFASLISVMIHNFCTFSSKLLYALDKKIRSKYKFSDFRLLAWKLTKFLISFFKSQVNFYLDFAIPFSVMTHNSSEIFQLKHYMLCTKRAHQCTIFQTFGCSNENSPNSSCHLGLFKFCINVQCHKR